MTLLTKVKKYFKTILIITLILIAITFGVIVLGLGLRYKYDAFLIIGENMTNVGKAIYWS